LASSDSLKHLYQKAADYIKQADSLLITAGAGIGVDSGLPDFRGTTGFWQAYPALGRKGMTFEKIAHPDNFRDDPKTAWGFYGHRLNLYRETDHHLGFKLLKAIGESMPKGYFVYTSNVDGQFQKAGFPEEKINECHGSIHHLQCSELKSEMQCNHIWSADDLKIKTDDINCQSTSELPVCPHCGSIARPNILMFYDFAWLPSRNVEQKKRYDAFLEQASNLVIIEVGAGTAIPTVRHQGDFQYGSLIRINPREPELNKKEGISIQVGALEALTGIYEYLPEIGRSSAFDPLDDDVLKKRINIDLECCGYRNETFPFRVKLYAGALADLIKDAQQAYRLYELFNIRRPGDLWKYFIVELVDVPDDIMERVNRGSCNRQGNKIWPDNTIPLNRFDSFFGWFWDDTEPDSECWLTEREGYHFIQLAKKCFSVVNIAKSLIQKQADPLIQHEIKLINKKDHRNDYLTKTPYKLTWPGYQSWVQPKYNDGYYKKLIEVIKNKNVQSIAYRFPIDYHTVRLLAIEQRVRTNDIGGREHEAFTLNILDDPHDELLEWGGTIFWYSEGIGYGDLFIEQESTCGSDVRELVDLKRIHSEYILLLDDVGELQGYTKISGTDWVLYKKIPETSV
jgi:NAD-dependent SIR2 family protein deacetylase